MQEETTCQQHDFIQLSKYKTISLIYRNTSSLTSLPLIELRQKPLQRTAGILVAQQVEGIFGVLFEHQFAREGVEPPVLGIAGLGIGDRGHDEGDAVAEHLAVSPLSAAGMVHVGNNHDRLDLAGMGVDKSLEAFGLLVGRGHRRVIRVNVLRGYALLRGQSTAPAGFVAVVELVVAAGEEEHFAVTVLEELRRIEDAVLRSARSGNEVHLLRHVRDDEKVAQRAHNRHEEHGQNHQSENEFSPSGESMTCSGHETILCFHPRASGPQCRMKFAPS